MQMIRNIIASLALVILTMLVVACQPDKNLDNFSLSCGAELTLRENATELIEVIAGGNYMIETDNNNAICTQDGNYIRVKAIKLGTCILTVTAESGEQATCTITIEKSSAQKDFLVFADLRIENWKDETLYVEKTDGLQVTCEKDTDVAGYRLPGTTTYGFYFVESGHFCRLSAPTDFAAKGIFEGGIVAIGDGNNDTRYYICDAVSVVKVSNGKAWVEASMAMHADLRLVVELY